jgi:AraC family transcriptional regulator
MLGPTEQDTKPEPTPTSIVRMTTPSADIYVMQMGKYPPVDRMLRFDDSYYINMCFSPRPERIRGCYTYHWGPHRFEQLGDIFIVPPGESIHLRSETVGDHPLIACELRKEAVDQWLEEAIEWTDRRLFTLLDIANPNIRTCLLGLAEETRYPGIASEVLIELYATQLGIQIARYCQSIVEGPIVGGLASWRLRLIDERLQDVSSPPSLGDLAELCNISVRQLTRGFRTSRGCSIRDHIAHTRIEAAQRRLASDESISKIAEALGFASPASFSSAFRRATGAGPRQFRQRRYPRLAKHSA